MGSLISIIVPIYNTEKYLEQCVTSLLSQTYRNLQIILVDDGSTDGSSKLCDVFAAKDSRVQVIHQKNQGVSAARNAGLDVMAGEYLLFVDGDDALLPNTIEATLHGFDKDEIGVTVFGVTKVYKHKDQVQDLPMETGVYSREEMLYGILKDYASFGAGFPVNKLWRVNVFGCATNIPRFDSDLYYFEDLEWVVRMLMHISKARLLPDHFYQYYIRSDSITHKSGVQERREIGYHQSIWHILDALKETPSIREWFSEQYYPEVVNGVINAWQNKLPTLQRMLLCKLEAIEKEILSSDVISLKIKFRCVVLFVLNKLGFLRGKYAKS